jgi:outer membrane protein assembly factor BamB
VIDLGELPRDTPPDVDARWPVVARLRHWHDRRGWRNRRAWQLAGVATVTALTAVVANAAAAPPRPALVPALQTQVMGHAYDNDHLYVVESAEQTGLPDPTVTAYRLPDGAVQWETSLPGADDVWLETWPGALLAVSYVSTAAGLPGEQTTRLDPATGEPLWTYAGVPLQWAGNRMLLQRQLPVTYHDEHAAALSHQEITAVDLTTGEPAWTAELSGGSFQLDATNPTSLVMLDEHGRLASYDLATGAELATRPAAAALQPDPMSGQPLATVIGSLALLAYRQDGAELITAYDATTLTPRWTVTRAATGSGLYQAVWPSQCGTLICLTGEGRPPRALDPATGAEVWSADWAPAGDGVFGVTEVGTGHLIVTWWPHDAADRSSWLVAADTGEPVLDLQGWNIAGSYWGAPPLAPDPVLTREGDGGTTIWIGRLRADRSAVEVLGGISHDPVDEMGFYYCDVRDRNVLCLLGPTTHDGETRVHVWRIMTDF